MRISDLPDYDGTPSETAVFPTTIGGVTYKATASDLAFEVFNLPYTYTPKGDVSVQTINKASGSANAASGALFCKVNNDKVTLNSIVFAVLMTNDAVAAVKNVVVGEGYFFVNFTGALDAEAQIGFMVINY